MNLPQRPLYVYVDESGDFEFSAKGSDYFVMAGMITDVPTETAQRVLDLKYELMQHDMKRPYFHATEDSTGVRKRMLDLIAPMPGFSVHAVWGDKHLASRKIHSKERFYSIFAGALAKFLVMALKPHYDPIVIVYDAAISKKEQSIFHKHIKPAMKEHGRTVRIHFDSIKHDPNGQIADYLAWAFQRSLEKSDPQAWDRLKHKLAVQPFNVFRKSNGTRYW